MVFKSEVESFRGNYSKITFGTATIKKINKVYSRFHILSSETILAHIKSAVPFMGELAVITDCAIYTYLSESVPISEVCGYLVAMADAKASVNISNAVGNRDILGGSFVVQNTAGIELTQFIKALQGKLLQTYPWARQQRDALANGIMAAARNEMKTGRISTEKLSQLSALSEEPAYCDSVTLLLGEDAFRSCGFAEYQRFVTQQESKVSYATKAALSNSQENFSAALIRDLGDLSLDFNSGYLETAYHNMSELTTYTESQCLILAYLCARLGKEEQFKTLREQVCRRCGEDKALSLDFFKGRYFNNRMKKVYELVKQGTMPPAEWLGWTDSVGLSALHYAILLNQETLVEDLLEKKTWTVKAPVSDGEAELLYDYTVLACYKNLSNRRTVFQKTSDLVAAQLRSRKALERRLWLKERKLDIQNASAQKARELMRTARKNGLYEKEEEWREKLDNVSMLRDETRMEIDEINQSISEIDYEISVLTSDAMVEAADTIQRLQSSTNPFVHYLFCLFSDMDALLHMISAQQEAFKLYSYKGFHFVTPADVHVDLPYTIDQKQEEKSRKSDYQESSQREYREQSQHSTNEQYHTHQEGTQQSQREQKKDTGAPIKKPYGISWFSPEAHRSMKKLKEEYRSLAKKYHPDVCDHPRSKEIFQDILNERADILEHMNNNMS